MVGRARDQIDKQLNMRFTGHGEPRQGPIENLSIFYSLYGSIPCVELTHHAFPNCCRSDRPLSSFEERKKTQVKQKEKRIRFIKPKYFMLSHFLVL